MNEYAKCLYDHMMECSFLKIKETPEYKDEENVYIWEENVLLQMLTPEQREQYFRCKEEETALSEISLRYMFQETLFLLRSLFFCG